MTDLAIASTTEAFKALLEGALDSGLVHVGAPAGNQVEDSRRKASLFLFHLQPNAELRNEQRFVAPPAESAAIQPAEPRDALPLDLRYLITVFRAPSSAIEANELVTLGQIIQAIHAQPILSGAALPDQTVHLTPEPYPMEEISRIWSLFPGSVYRTSVVYLASPVYVEAGAAMRGPPVQERRQRMGVDRGLPNILGRAQVGADDGTA